MSFARTALGLALAGAVLIAPHPAPAETPGPAGSAAALENSFALDLYRRLASDGGGGNLVCSPYPIYVALAMTAEGARGQTADEMGRVLHLPASLRRGGRDAAARPWALDSLHAGLGDWAGAIGRQDAGRYDLNVANALWGDKGRPFAPRYVKTISRYYGTGGLRSVDFRGDAEGARTRINSWTSDQTAGRIRDLLPPGSVERTTRLVLTSAIYFKGQWAEAFDKARTKEEPFRLAGGRTASVPLMRRELEGAEYGAFDADGRFFATPPTTAGGAGSHAGTPALYPRPGGFQVVELPYRGGDVSMVVLLPGSPGGLGSIERLLTPDHLSGWLDQLESRRVDVQLPRFHLEQARPLDLALQAMGMKRAFVEPIGGRGADFTGMTGSSNPADALFVGGVLHQALVEVNEQGTEAAAATGVVMRVLAAAPGARPFVPTFRADRPFLFLIRDVRSGGILFLGRFARPG